MDLNFKPGDKLILELQDECLIGELVHINLKSNRIQLKNVSDFFNENESISATQIYYKKEIKSIHLLETGNLICNTTKTVGGSLNKQILKPLIHTQSTIKTCKEIYQIDAKFYEAIGIIYRNNKIGLSSEGAIFGRHSKISIICISLVDVIFVFDIVSLGQIPIELKNILESNNIRKVTHDGRKLADNLIHKFGVHLNCVFDTMVAYLSITMEKKPINLHDCIVKYYDLPQNYFCSSLSPSDIDWMRRPLTMEQKHTARENVHYLLQLESYFTSLLLDPFYKSVDVYLDSLRSVRDNIDNAKEIINPENKGIANINLFELNVNEIVNNLK